MSKQSLSHNYAQNQSKTSWSDDPFDLKGLVTGVTHVNHERNLNDYAEQLVANYAKFSYGEYELSLEMIPEDYLNDLVRLYIESIDREIEDACYGGQSTLNSDYMCALLAMLKNDNKETRERFAKVTRKNLISYYKKPLEELLNNACNSYLHSINNENGYYAYQDLDHGDLVWRKS